MASGYGDKIKSKINICFFSIFLVFMACAGDALSHPDPLPDTIARLRPSILGIGTVQKTRRPPAAYMGTGFVVGDGLHAITNAHVIPEKLNEKYKEKLAVFVGLGKKVTYREAVVVSMDLDHDLCLLRFTGSSLPAMKVGNGKKVREGQRYAFSGYPLGMALGLNTVTHTGIVSAISEIITPVRRSNKLNNKRIKHLSRPYLVYQLDATAYPGNSGSPLYDIETGKVIGVINKVFVKGSKENALKDPSGITYAIPGRYALKIIKDAGLE